ncbi:sugar phosphate nucleotidyltransferase [Caulobacter sp. CCG-8]|uniref:sugar phosphate nucleotidyltransferase n=2 Tax=unclassified Caulobacter TaxID=2648921 RepID=UPI00307D1B20
MGMRILVRSDVPVFILCGGLGTRLREQTEFRPKPMVPIGGQPALWHIMRLYAHFGFRKFVLCMGYRSEVIREYFLNFHRMTCDATVQLGTDQVTFHSVEGLTSEADWEVTLAYTGELTMTGGRVFQAASRYLGDAEHFAVTYGDGVTDAHIGNEFKDHVATGKIGTVLGVNPPSRFGEFKFDNGEAFGFEEKPEIEDHWINGGFFFFKRQFMSYLNDDPALVLEQNPLRKLAADRQLNVFKHSGEWACMDTQRDVETLNKAWTEGRAFWDPSHLPPRT